MSAFDILLVRVQTLAKVLDKFGNEKAAAVDVEGGPFRARMYRGGGSGAGYVRREDSEGSSTIETRRVLSFLDPIAKRAVKNGMTAIVPPCDGNGYAEEIVSIERVRPYRNSLQCDLVASGQPPSGGISVQ